MPSQVAKERAEREQLEQAIVNDSLLALGATFVGASLLSVAAHKFSPTYRKIPISAKTVLVLGPSLAAFYIRGEHVGIEMRRNKYAHQLEPEEQEAIAKQREALQTRGDMMSRTVDYVTENRWSLLGYTWLAAISGSIYHLYRKKGMTVTQKAVQARMYAQLITIVGILSTAGVASLSDKSNNKHALHHSAALEAALAGDTKVPSAASMIQQQQQHQHK